MGADEHRSTGDSLSSLRWSRCLFVSPIYPPSIVFPLLFSFLKTFDSVNSWGSSQNADNCLIYCNCGTEPFLWWLIASENHLEIRTRIKGSSWPVPPEQLNLLNWKKFLWEATRRKSSRINSYFQDFSFLSMMTTGHSPSENLWEEIRSKDFVLQISNPSPTVA